MRELNDGRHARAGRTRVYGAVAAAASPDGKWAAAATTCGHICFIDAADGVSHRAWQEAGNGIRDVAFSADGKTLYTAGQDFRAWDVKVDELPGRTATSRGVVPAAERERDEKAHLRVRTGRATRWPRCPGTGRRRGRLVRQPLGDVERSDAVRGPKWEKPKHLSDAMGDATFVAAAPDGKTLAVGCNSNRAELWDVTAGRTAAVRLEGRATSRRHLPRRREAVGGRRRRVQTSRGG